MKIFATFLFLGLLPCTAFAQSTCAPTSMLNSVGTSFNAKSSLDGSSNCFGYLANVDSSGANLFPNVAALSDTTSNPTTALIGSLLEGWDSTNSVWKRLQVDAATGTLKADISAGTLPPLVAGSAIAGKFGIDQTTPGTTNAVQPLPGTGGGWSSKLLNALSTTIVAVKGAGVGKMGVLQCWNPNSVVSYVQGLDATAPTLGSTAPIFSVGFAPNQSQTVNLTEIGANFANQIKVAATTTATGSTAPATALDCNAWYN